MQKVNIFLCHSISFSKITTDPAYPIRSYHNDSYDAPNISPNSSDAPDKLLLEMVRFAAI